MEEIQITPDGTLTFYNSYKNFSLSDQRKTPQIYKILAERDNLGKDEEFVCNNYDSYGNPLYVIKREYNFKTNGAMATDRNKGLNMTYDPYNAMPKKITVSNTNTNGSNSYVYTATGQKLKVTYTWSDPLILTPLSGLTSFSLNLNLV